MPPHSQHTALSTHQTSGLATLGGTLPEDVATFIDGLDMGRQDLGLTRMQQLLSLLKHPERAYPVIHVGGSNGKGSVVAMLVAVLKAAGYRVGSTISPHLQHVTERVQLQGQPISTELFSSVVRDIRNQLLTTDWSLEQWPTYFEFMVAVALETFRREAIDIAVVEVGLGGRLDATNAMEKTLLSIVTSISLEHTEWLGNTLAAIAYEKAGIFRENTPVVLGPQDPNNLPAEAAEVLYQQASLKQCPIFQANSNWLQPEPNTLQACYQSFRHVETSQTLSLSLLGEYQQHNLATVLASLSVLQQQGFSTSWPSIAAGLKQVHWPARFQYFPNKQLLIDGSHNAQGFESLQRSLAKHFPGRPAYWLLSLRQNRPLTPLLRLVEEYPDTRGIVFTALPEKSTVYHSPQQLREAFRKQSVFEHIPLWASQHPHTAKWMLDKWLSGSSHSENCLGIATGSLYVAGTLLDSVTPTLEEG
ncbi:MAG: Mur ligase family protein [Candidatus Melainabacteria bacterium]|nr:Mur ligase family protein [Candidatus Melainabacteria bacterium]